MYLLFKYIVLQMNTIGSIFNLRSNPSNNMKYIMAYLNPSGYYLNIFNCQIDKVINSQSYPIFIDRRQVHKYVMSCFQHLLNKVKNDTLLNEKITITIPNVELTTYEMQASKSIILEIITDLISAAKSYHCK
jgi:hypothetical protein